jgi:transcriptional regulator with XRE-family HTH domain
MKDTGFRDRLFRAWYLFQAREGGERSQEWLAEAVSAHLGLEDTLTQSAVSRWLNGAVPPLGTIVALAKVLGVDPGWLAFGKDSAAPPPSDPMMEGMRSILQPED